MSEEISEGMRGRLNFGQGVQSQMASRDEKVAFQEQNRARGGIQGGVVRPNEGRSD